MISAQALIVTIFALVIVGIIFWLLNWLIDYCEPPEPFRKVAKILLAVFGVAIAISLLLNLIGFSVFRW